MHKFYKEVIANYLHTKEIFTFLAFLKCPSDYLNFATFLHILNGMVIGQGL